MQRVGQVSVEWTSAFVSSVFLCMCDAPQSVLLSCPSTLLLLPLTSGVDSLLNGSIFQRGTPPHHKPFTWFSALKWFRETTHSPISTRNLLFWWTSACSSPGLKYICMYEELPPVSQAHCIGLLLMFVHFLLCFGYTLKSFKDLCVLPPSENVSLAIIRW